MTKNVKSIESTLFDFKIVYKKENVYYLIHAKDCK